MQKNTTSSATFADTKPHYELLDGLRGVAALLVVFYHIFEGFSFAELTNAAGDGVISTLNHGHIAVDFFFMLSGFVISYAYDDRWGKMSIGDFFKRRLVRLHPMVVMGALVGVATFVAAGCRQWDGTVTPASYVLMALVLTMFMVPALPGLPYEVRGNGEMFPLNGPAWSLFFEYVGNILYALFIRRFSTKALAILAAALGIAHAFFFVGDVSGYGCVGVGWTIDSVNFFGGLVRMLFPFTVGMLLARTFVPRKVKGAFWVCTILLVAIFSVPYIASAGSVSLNSLYEVICIALLFPLIVWMGACGTCGDSFTGRVSKLLGDLSYPLYIVHYPIMYLFYAWLIEEKHYTLGETWAVSAMVVAASILLAFLLLKLYDEPVRRYLAGKFLKR
ncbi:MAG: acyltransferase [Bacteroidaceae bacterium]|nr:acyltransferase [Bacteroidaceae bacterium]